MRPDGFAAAFRQHFPDLIGKPILVALSGGADSVALLCLLHEAAGELACPLFAAHVHHHLRGAEADADAAHCVPLCERLGVPLAVEHLEPTRPRGSSPEAWWRQARYRALEVARQRLGGAAVATAHTLDDQAETVLLKLLRGAGPRGVAGIRRRVGMVIRPLLDFRRAALREWLGERGVGWREDASNADAAFPRAWLRRHALPLLEGRFPRGVDHVAAFAADLAEDEVFLAASLGARAVFPDIGQAVALAAVASLPGALRRRWVLELSARLPLAEAPSRRQLDQVSALLNGEFPAAVDLGRRWVLRRHGATLRLSPPPLDPFAAWPAVVGTPVELPGGFVGRVGLSATPQPSHRAVLHPRVAVLPLAWRSVAPGERFGVAPGAVARRLAAAGIPREWRRAWPGLMAGGTMVWLPAVGVAPGWEGNEAEGVVAELEEPWKRHAR